MSVLVGRSTRVVVQGITGRDGSFHTRGMLDYGTKVVAGVTPGKGGEKVHGVPVFDSVADAVKKTGANCSVIYVPAPLAQDAMYEAVDAGIPLVVCISEGIPVRDMVEVSAYLKGRPVRLIGPNCPGLISPGQSKVGIMPGSIVKPGKVGVVSRSGTLTYEVVWQLTRAGLGQSTCIGIGGDPIVGTRFADMLALRSAAATRKTPRRSSSVPSRSLSWPSSRGRPRPPESAWDTRARSSPADREPRRRRWPASWTRASRSRRRRPRSRG